MTPEELEIEFKDIISAGYIEISYPPVWNNLIFNLCIKIRQLNTKTKIVQIKEKFGTLRFYVDNSTTEIDNLISRTEILTEFICCRCGSSYGARTKIDRVYFILCNPCKIIKQLRTTKK